MRPDDLHRIAVAIDAEVAGLHGAEVPFLRPPELADDFAGTTAVIAHATRWMLEQGWSVDAVCCLYATAPFVLAEDIRQGREALESGPWAYAFSATEFPAPRRVRLADRGISLSVHEAGQGPAVVGRVLPETWRMEDAKSGSIPKESDRLTWSVSQP